MGLDQYWFKTKEQINTPVDFKVEDKEDLHYHRKVPALQAYMQELYNKKGGTDTDFNVSNVLITKEDLDLLKELCKRKKLDSEATGFFWGTHYDEDYEDILDAVWKAYRAIDEGYNVYYTSWY